MPVSSPDAEPDPSAVLAFHKSTHDLSWGVSNYSPGRLVSLLSFLTADAPKRRLKITFDDGYAHLLELLPSLIERFPVDVELFLPTAWLGRSNAWDYSHRWAPSRHLSRGEVAGLSRLGVRFGSHGDTHADLTGMSPARLLLELRTSKLVIEDCIGAAVDSISYPFGRTNQRVIKAARECGYRAGYTMKLPRAGDDPLAIGRIPVYGFDSPYAVCRRMRCGIVERGKCSVVSGLSRGTILLQALRRSAAD